MEEVNYYLINNDIMRQIGEELEVWVSSRWVPHYEVDPILFGSLLFEPISEVRNHAEPLSIIEAVCRMWM